MHHFLQQQKSFECVSLAFVFSLYKFTFSRVQICNYISLMSCNRHLYGYFIRIILVSLLSRNRCLFSESSLLLRTLPHMVLFKACQIHMIEFLFIWSLCLPWGTIDCRSVWSFLWHLVYIPCRCIAWQYSVCIGGRQDRWC